VRVEFIKKVEKYKWSRHKAYLGAEKIPWLHSTHEEEGGVLFS
jgi:hypothetical protein